MKRNLLAVIVEPERVSPSELLGVAIAASREGFISAGWAPLSETPTVESRYLEEYVRFALEPEGTLEFFVNVADGFSPGLVDTSIKGWDADDVDEAAVLRFFAQVEASLRVNFPAALAF